jgi:hypothetical protein
MLVIDTVFRRFSHDKCVLSILGHPFCAELDGGPGRSTILYYDIGARLFSQDRNIIFVSESDPKLIRMREITICYDVTLRFILIQL